MTPPIIKHLPAIINILLLLSSSRRIIAKGAFWSGISVSIQSACNLKPLTTEPIENTEFFLCDLLCSVVSFLIVIYG